ncbi:MAG: cytochrome C [Deltaproteobacteria bacterium]
MAETLAPIDSGIVAEEVKVTAGKKRSAALSELPDKVHTWPYLVRAEFIAGCVLILALLVWSITIDAPMEEPANPTKTPNPSKAPWYFLGLQEMLVYFDPWFAGVVAPSLIIVGLMVIPYVDTNPNGNGYYTWKERKFAMGTFLFGFLALWCVQIVLGVFFRGPGWNFFLPGAYWDPHKVVAMTNVDLPYLLGARTEVSQMLVGMALVGAYFSLIPACWILLKDRPWMRELGAVRYGIVSFLFFTELGIVVKMVLRWTLAVKYIMVIPNIINI